MNGFSGPQSLRDFRETGPRSITRPELVSGEMAANYAKHLHNTLKRWPIVSPTVWMKSMVTLCWIRKPVKPWKVLSNRVKNMKQITGEMGIIWMYCPMEKNLADLGSIEARINKMETMSCSQVPITKQEAVAGSARC